LNSLNVKERIAKLELTHQNEKQQQQITLLDRENKTKQQKIRTRNFLIFSLVTLSIAIVLFWLLYRQSSIRRLTEMEAELQKYILWKKEHSAIPDEPRIDSEAFSEKYDLTQRETEVILLISQGMSNADIADKIFVSSNTVKYHIKNIYLKLDVSNRVEALNKVVN
jgi:ATP/maltotriose-dependent transcriptional regulator MalT